MKKFQKNSKKELRIMIPSGWDTSDEDEVNRRLLRAKSEVMKITSLEPQIPYFSNYSVKSSSGSSYYVEIRSLTEQINSCSCVDYETNQLGVCKHIKKVILSLEEKGKQKFISVSEKGSQRAEIYVNPSDDAATILFPKNEDIREKVKNILGHFFSSDGKLMADISLALPAIKRAIIENSDIKNSVRFSANLDKAEKRAIISSQKQEIKDNFLEDIATGKRSLDVMKLPLYQYQQQGMMHLAFAGRAILADEMGLGKTVQAIAACELLRRLSGVKKF